MMSDLYNRCGSIRKQIAQLPTGTHNETWILHGYYHSLAVFLQNCRLQKVDKLENSSYSSSETEPLIQIDKVWSEVQHV